MAGTEEALETSEFLESLGIEADSLPGLTSTHPKNRAQLGMADRVSDPYSFFTDPDPEDPDGGQYGSGYGYGSGSNPDPGL